MGTVERENENRIKNLIQMEKTAGFQPQNQLDTNNLKVEALCLQCLHSFFIRLSLNATASFKIGYLVRLIPEVINENVDFLIAQCYNIRKYSEL